MQLEKKQKEKLRTLVVEFLLDVRRQYARTSGFNPLEQWNLLSNRMRSAARTSGTVDQWCTSLMRSLQIEAPDKASSDSLLALSHWVVETDAHLQMMGLIETEFGHMVAMARKILDERREAYNASTITADGEILETGPDTAA